MGIKRHHWLLLLLILFSVLFSQTAAWLPLEAPSAVGIPYEGANEPDQASLEADTDILQNALAENYDVPRNARQADTVFTRDYRGLLGQISAKKHLESHIGKWVGNDVLEDQGPVKRQSDVIFTHNYSQLLKKIALRKYLERLAKEAGKPKKKQTL